MNTKQQQSLRILTRGLHINAHCVKGRIVDLTVRAQQQHKGMWLSFRQHLANALYRIADICHPSNQHRGVRVVAVGMPLASFNDGSTQIANTHVRDVWPVKTSNGDAYYNAFLIHEGVKRGHDGVAVASKFTGLLSQKSADDSHGNFPVIEKDVEVHYA